VIVLETPNVERPPATTRLTGRPTSADALAIHALAQINADIVSGQDPSEWKVAIQRLASDPEKARELKETRRTIDAWAADRTATRMLDARRLEPLPPRPAP
jgi:hypothetical protein